MSKAMLVNVTHVEESRVAVVDNGVLETYEIETINRAQIKGNIYNAVVENVHPSLEAAFLKLSPELKGFLPLDEVNFTLLPVRDENRKAGRIGQHLRPGQRLLAQVVREPFAEKPPTVSTYFSLPGRFLVLMPGVDNAGVSRKIEDPEQRERLRKIADELLPPEGFGLIVRTAGMGQTKLELQRDLRYLLRLWQSIQKASAAAEFPALVYREADLVIRTIRDHLSLDVDEVWIDSRETYNKALAFVSDVMPNRAKTLRLYAGERPLFSKFNLEEQIESIYQRRVSLPSGGEIVIDGTEALTAIDVNSARSRRTGDAEDNALQTNIEAASEIARQLRLRDLGGLIVIDFIDMAAPKNNKKVEEAMRTALKGDKARHDMTRLSKMGLMEIARQRLKAAKMSATYATCPTCEGYGLIKNLESAALAALRKLQTRTARADIGRAVLRVPPDVADWILNNKRDELSLVERRHDLRLGFEPQARLLRHEAEIETFPREERGAAGPTRHEGPPARPAPGPAAPAASPGGPTVLPEVPPPDPAAEPAEKRRRRRRRRRDERPELPPRESDAGADDAVGPVVAGANRPSAVPPSGGADDAKATGGAGPLAEPGAVPPRRKRRRRRRSRPAATDGATTPPASPPEEERLVPRGVRVDELMPAARGGRGGRGRREASGRRRRPGPES